VPDSLVKIDARTHEVVDVFPVGRDTGVEIVGGYVFVANEEDGTLTRVDRRTGAVVTSERYDAGRGIAGEGGKRLWVGSPRRHEVTAVDIELPGDEEDRASERRVPLGLAGGGTLVEVGGGSLSGFQRPPRSGGGVYARFAGSEGNVIWIRENSRGHELPALRARGRRAAMGRAPRRARGRPDRRARQQGGEPTRPSWSGTT
jgi:hypothetical protein